MVLRGASRYGRGQVRATSYHGPTGCHTADDVEKVQIIDSLELYLAFSMQTSDRIIKAWEDAFRAIKKDGTFAKIYTKWLPNETVPMNFIRLNPPGR